MLLDSVMEFEGIGEGDGEIEGFNIKCGKFFVCFRDFN